MNLAEKYRPRSLDELVGQSAAVEQVRRVLARGWGGRAWWITGPSGSGKTTLARIIANMGADELGIEEIDAGTLTPAKLREIEQECRFRMLGTKPGRAYIVNESHGLRKDTIRQLLVTLERLPDFAVWIFSTTKSGEAKLFDDDVAGDAAPLLSRCIEVTLVADARAFAERAKWVAVQEGMDGLPLEIYMSAVAAGGNNLRRVLARIESGAFRADARAQMAEQLKELDRDYAMVAKTKGEAAAQRRAALEASKAALMASMAKLHQQDHGVKS
jgi:replication-associated recombination protein RarA